jgi:hypothetical protein
MGRDYHGRAAQRQTLSKNEPGKSAIRTMEAIFFLQKRGENPPDRVCDKSVFVRTGT